MISNKAWFRVHSFTGVITGLLLFVICWSGTFAVFSDEIDWLIEPGLRIEPAESRLEWSELLAAVKAAFPQARVMALDAPLYPNAAAVAALQRRDGRRIGALVNPYTGKITGLTSGYTVQRFFRDLHRRLFYPNPWGVCLVAVFGLTMLASLIAALQFYKRWWRRFFRFTRGRGRRLWSELHKLAGLWSLWFVLLIALTGLWYGFEQIRIHGGDGISTYAGNPGRSVQAIPKPAPDSDGPPLALEVLMTKVRDMRPDLQVKGMRFGREGVLYVDGQAGHLLVRDRANQLSLDVHTGEVLYDQRATDLPAYWRWADTADPLHFGNFGGLISKSIWFVFGLVLSGLILTGTYLHAHRLAQERGGGARYRWPGTLAAMLVSFLVLAASIPFALGQARTFFGPVGEGDALPLLAPGVQAVIIGWVAGTLLILAFWVGLLWKPAGFLKSHGRMRAAKPGS